MLAPVARRLSFLSPLGEAEAVRRAPFVLCVGAARYAAVCSGLSTEFDFVSPARPGIGVELANGCLDLVLPTDCQVGDTGYRVYTNSEDLSGAVTFRFWEGFAREAASNRLVHQHHIVTETAEHKQCRIAVTVGLREQATVDVDIRDCRDGPRQPEDHGPPFMLHLKDR